MHNIDRNTMREILRNLSRDEVLDAPATLLELLRSAYEKAVLYQYTQQTAESTQEKDNSFNQGLIDFAGSEPEEPIEPKDDGEIVIFDVFNEKSASSEEIVNKEETHSEETIIEEQISSSNIEPPKEEIKKEEHSAEQVTDSDSKSVQQDANDKEPESELSFKEKIQQILANAPKLDDPPRVSAKPAAPPSKEEVESQTQPTATEPEKKTPKSTPSPASQEGSKDNKSADFVEKSFEEEFKEAISADYAAELFEKSTPADQETKSLNDKLSSNQLIIGLNDRIAFVKHLFAGDLFAFNKSLEHIQGVNTFDEALAFVREELKPKYEWGEKEQTYEERFISIIERKFG